jgi:hypothetical protein
MKHQRVLVLGAGIAGLSSALMMARHGFQVSIIESQSNWEIAGAGLTISGPSFRAIEALGVLQDVSKLGHTHSGIKVHDPDGQVIKSILSPGIVSQAGDLLPGAGGILRGTLHHILRMHLERLGVQVQMGVRVLDLEDALRGSTGSERLRLTLSDARVLSFDVVVLAEGLYSSDRKALFPQSAEPQWCGQACWRVVVPRPAVVDQRFFYLGGRVKVGLTPVSNEEMYLFLLESMPSNILREKAELYLILKELLSDFQGEVQEIRASLNKQSNIVYRPLEAHLLSTPWYKGRVVMVGDAAHATTPQLASGAGMAMEDAIVLTEELLRAKTVHEAYEAYFARRFERCKLVVENSLKVGRLEQARASALEQADVVDASLRELAKPY